MSSIEYRCTIKELPEEERPREKLLKYGVEQLSNAELIALIIRSGVKKRTAVELAQDIINYAGGLRGIIDSSVEEFKNIKGVGLAKATQLRAVIELSKRIFSAGKKEKMVVKTPQEVFRLIMPGLRYSKQEVFGLVLLDIKNCVISTPYISKGGLNSSIVHPRDVFREAIRRNSAAIILFHNHPSGVPEPSKEDIILSKRLIKSGKIIGIDVLDHIIVGDNIYISMKEQGII
ncbi:MAG: RadC family protein [Halanaerobiales bacterium]